MKSYVKIILVLSFASLVSLTVLAADNLPSRPPEAIYVNDYAGALKPAERAQLEAKLSSYEQQSSNEVVIVIVKSTAPYEISDYAVQLGRKWGVGKKENKGVMLIWSISERQVFIATGYGVEGDLTDALSKRIIEQIIIPHFKQSQFYAGLDEGSNAIIKILSGENINLKQNTQEGQAGLPVGFIILFILIIIFSSRRRGGFTSGMILGSMLSSGRGGGWGGGGGFGGGSFGGGGAGGRY